MGQSLSPNRQTLQQAAGTPVQATKAFSAVGNGDLGIEWSIQFGTGVTTNSSLGILTGNPFYIVYSKPANNNRPLYESVLKAGSVYNKRLPDSTNSVITNAWKAFSKRQVPSVKAIRSGLLPGYQGYYLTYYGNYKDHKPNSENTASLLSTGDGDCVAWAKFWMDVLEAQGIKEDDWSYTVAGTTTDDQPWQLVVKQWTYPLTPGGLTDPNQRTLVFPPALKNAKFPTLAGVMFYVNTYNKVLEGDHDYSWINWAVKQNTTSKANIAGQDNFAPASLFKGHNLVKITNPNPKTGYQFYDPSYGTAYAAPDDETGLKNFKINAVQGFALGFLGFPLNPTTMNYDPTGTLTNVVLFLSPGDKIGDQANAPVVSIVRTIDKTTDNY